MPVCNACVSSQGLQSDDLIIQKRNGGMKREKVIRVMVVKPLLYCLLDT